MAIEPNVAPDFIDIVEKQDIAKITDKIKDIKDNIYILDGLQRTHKIKELLDSDVKFKNEQKLLLEFSYQFLLYFLKKNHKYNLKQLQNKQTVLG